MKKVVNILNLIPIIFFTFILVGAFFYPANVYHSYSRVYAVLFAFIVLAIWYVVSKIINKIDDKKFKIVEIIGLIIIYSLILVIELIVMYNLKVSPGWDFGVIFSNSLTYFETGVRNIGIYPGYFEYFPNNIMAFILDLIAIKIGNVVSLTPMNSCILMNTAFINLGIIFLYIAARKIYGRKYALLSQILVLFFVPIFLYIPIFYSDTYSFYIPIGLLLFLTLIKKEKLDSKKSYIKYIISSIIVGLLLFLGKEIKVTSLIVFIAFLIFYLFYKNKRKFDIVACLIIFVVFITSEVLFANVIVNNKKFNFNDLGSGSYPYTHWLMMGTEDVCRDNSNHNSYGGYNVDDYYLTNKYLQEGNAAQKNIEEYIRRVKKMGPYEYYNYLNKKAVNAWTDGYYFADVKLSLKPTKEDSEVRKFLFVNEDSKNFMINFLQGVQFSFLIIFILGYIIKNNSNKIDILRLSIFGLMFFLLFWENRSRYIYNFIPIFILVITEFYYKLNRLVKKV